ncbi:MAG: rhodanese-like domain-containing protein [Gammaproteobacteria bacterium]
MDQFIEFAGNHFLLVTSFFFVLTLLIINLMQDSGSIALSPQQAVGFLNGNDAIAIDMRPSSDFDAGHIINAEQIDAADLKPDKEKIAAYKERPILIYCVSGTNSAAVVRQLRRAGFANARSLKGGITAWRSDNLPTTKKA